MATLLELLQVRLHASDVFFKYVWDVMAPNSLLLLEDELTLFFGLDFFPVT